MKKIYQIYFFTILIISVYSCSEKSFIPTDEGGKLVYEMVQKVGDLEKLKKKKDVTYTYTYQTPDGKKDISQEKYIFEGELSYGKYSTHQRTLADLSGILEQGYDGKEYWLKVDGTIINDEKGLSRVKFNRPTNFYWFTMMQKLLDPNLIYNHKGDHTINGESYDVVSVSFAPQQNKPTDIYELFINKKTGLVDQFLFTVADFGVIEEPFLMELEYEEIDGILIPSKRRYKKSTWDAIVTDEPWITVSWTNIKFNTNLSKRIFSKS